MASLSSEDLLRELAGLFQVTAAAVARAAAAYAELLCRGVAVDGRSLMFATFVPAVARGTLAAEAVVAFADEPHLLQRVAHLQLADQRRLAAGNAVEVVTAAGAGPVAMSIRDAYRLGHARQVFAGGRQLASPDRQRDFLARGERRRVEWRTGARSPRTAVRRKNEPVPTAATDDQVATLAAAVAAAGPLTVELFVRVAAALGWVPRRREGR